ncbi:hypothetical protein LCGC14_0416040 [marine sediment metagenome]|uniref:Uncharacterized protein n=1 Tax=marine sediment metagenome TaxID=412755 RepID=A0A0F9W1M6_9ZZZZ
MSKYPPLDVERITRELYSPFPADIPIRIKNWTSIYKPEAKIMSKFMDKLLKRKREKIVPYEEIRDSLQTFDIINCVPSGGLLGWLWALIGHTAMVYVCKATSQVMVYESTQTGRGDNKSGVQLRPMREWVENYKGKIYISQTEIIGDTLRCIAEDRCGCHIRKYRGTAYPNLKKAKGLWFVINSAIDLPFDTGLENPDVDFWFFCTHLIGDVFRWCLLISDAYKLNPAELEPDDTRKNFYGVSKFEKSMRPSVSSKVEIRIK